MRVLALDTTQWSSSVALWEDGKELAFQENSEGRGQAALLPSLIQEVLGNHSVDALLVNRGPGSFTGIRLGIAFATGFSLGLSLPLKGLDGFQALYHSLPPHEGNVLILIEAHRQDIFGQFFQEGLPLPPQSFTREELGIMLKGTCPPLLAGSGLHSPILEGLPFQELTPLWEGARALAYTFFKDPDLGEAPSPLYIRPADITYTSTH